MNNQERKVRSKIVNVNSDEPVFFSFSIRTSKWSGSCNNINNPYAKLCVPEVVKNLNVRAFNLMSRTNKTRHKARHWWVFRSAEKNLLINWLKNELKCGSETR